MVTKSSSDSVGWMVTTAVSNLADLAQIEIIADRETSRFFSKRKVRTSLRQPASAG